MNLRDGSVSRATAEKVQKLRNEGWPVTRAMAHVARGESRPVKSVSSAYYRTFPVEHSKSRRRAASRGQGDEQLDMLVHNLDSAAKELREYVQTNQVIKEAARALSC